MPLDPSIALQFKGLQIEDPVNQLSRVLNLQNAQQANQLNTLKADEYQRGVARQNRLRDFLAGGAGLDEDAAIKRLRNSEFQDEASKRAADLMKRREVEAQTMRERSGALEKLGNFQKQLATQVMANPSPEFATAALDQMEQAYKFLSIDSRPIAAQRQMVARMTTPEQLKSWAEGHSLAADKLLPKIDTQNYGGFSNDRSIDPRTGKVIVTNTVTNTQDPNNAATVAATLAGQRSVAATAAAKLKQDAEQFNTTQNNAGNQYDTERGVIVNTRTGLARPAATLDGKPLGAKDKPMTEGQAKAALFGARAEQSDKILANLAAKGTVKSVPGSNAPFVGGAITAVSSEQQQQLSQAKRDFINAVLRRESGAVISPEEFDNAEKQYFPQIGDKPETVKQKAANRATAIRGIQVEIPNSRAVIDKITTPSRSGGWGIQKVD